MAFDGFIVKSIVTELNNTIIGGKINKIYEPNNNEIIIDLYNDKKMSLDICINSCNCRINLTKYSKVNPKKAPNFCMVLRKYLTSAKVSNISNYNLDRIIFIELQNYNELNDLVTYKLIIELMGKHSNIILVNEKNIIIDSLRHISSIHSLRNIIPANPYILPESNKLDLLTINQEQFIDVINSSKTENNNLINICSSLFTGISKSFMIFTLKELNINNLNYTISDLVCLYNYIKNIIHSISSNNVTCKCFYINNKKDFCIVVGNTDKTNCINNFIDEFYINKESEESFKNYKNTVLKIVLALLAKYNKKIINIQKKLEECKNIENYRLYGELLTSTLYRINNNINISYIELENYYDNNNILKIELDNTISPSANAKKFFKKYTKLKNTLKIVNKQKLEIQNEISYLESIIYSLENCTTIEEIDDIYEEITENIIKKPNNNKVKISNNNIHYLIIDNFKVYIGKNNKQNDFITFKLSDKNDIWFHVQGLHGSHVLLKTNNVIISDDNPIIPKCAKLAALHSKGCSENKVLVDYTLIKNIRKPKNAKPGFVIFNTYKSILIENN